MKPEIIYGHTTLRHAPMAALITDGGKPGMGNLTWIEWVMAVAIVSILCAIIYGGYRESQRPGFTLKKDDWVCAASHEESTTTFVNTGDGKTIVLIPITTTSTVCDQWHRRAR